MTRDVADCPEGPAWARSAQAFTEHLFVWISWWTS